MHTEYDNWLCTYPWIPSQQDLCIHITLHSGNLWNPIPNCMLCKDFFSNLDQIHMYRSTIHTKFEFKPIYRIPENVRLWPNKNFNNCNSKINMYVCSFRGYHEHLFAETSCAEGKWTKSRNLMKMIDFFFRVEMKKSRYKKRFSFLCEKSSLSPSTWH